MMLGLWRKRCASDLTRVSLSQLQHGMWERGQELLGEAQKQAANNQMQVGGLAGLAGLGCVHVTWPLELLDGWMAVSGYTPQCVPSAVP